MYCFSLRTVLGGLVALALTLGGLVVAGTPFALAQHSASTGRTLTDFAQSLTVAGFDGAAGQLVAADVTLSVDLDSRVVEISNSSAGAADFSVTTSVRFCSAVGSVPANYADCVATPSDPRLQFETAVLSESFIALPAGQSAWSVAPATTHDIASLRVLDEAALAQFIDAGPFAIGVATLAGFQSQGGGGNSRVEIETFADVAAQVDYMYAGVRLDKQTNGGDGVAVAPGEVVEWTYDVTNTGNTTLQHAIVVDDQEGTICTIARIDVSATERCTARGIAGSVDYQNTARVIAEPIVNPSLPVDDDDTSSYVVVAPTPTAPPLSPPLPPAASPPLPPAASPPLSPPAPPEALPPGSVPPGAEGPAIDIELLTNGIDADQPPGVSLTVGQPITWTYLVANTGVVDLYDVVVNDDAVGGVCRAPVIRVNGDATCVRSGVATEGSFSRVGDVIGVSKSGERVVDTDPTHHVVGDEVLGKVLDPEPGRSVPLVLQPSPDEVLAYTGANADQRGLAGGILIGAGCVVTATASWVRRRRTGTTED